MEMPEVMVAKKPLFWFFLGLPISLYLPARRWNLVSGDTDFTEAIEKEKELRQGKNGRILPSSSSSAVNSSTKTTERFTEKENWINWEEREMRMLWRDRMEQRWLVGGFGFWLKGSFLPHHALSNSVKHALTGSLTFAPSSFMLWQLNPPSLSPTKMPSLTSNQEKHNLSLHFGILKNDLKAKEMWFWLPLIQDYEVLNYYANRVALTKRTMDFCSAMAFLHCVKYISRSIRIDARP